MLRKVRLRPLGRRFRIARISAGFSLDEWAAELEVDPEWYEQIEQGLAAPDVSTITYVSHLTARTTDWLLTGRSPAGGDGDPQEA